MVHLVVDSSDALEVEFVFVRFDSEGICRILPNNSRKILLKVVVIVTITIKK